MTTYHTSVNTLSSQRFGSKRERAKPASVGACVVSGLRAGRVSAVSEPLAQL